MALTADVVVVGGGVNGVSIAHALAGRGVRVVLVEKGALASGASGRSSALVRMHYTNEWDARLAWASFPVFRHWPELMGGPPVFTHTGFVNVVGPAHAENLRRNVAMLQGIGVPTRAITAAELRELQPYAHVDDVGAAAYEPESGYADPAETVEGFRRRATELGARILQGTEVIRVDRGESRVVVAARYHGQPPEYPPGGICELLVRHRERGCDLQIAGLELIQAMLLVRQPGREYGGIPAGPTDQPVPDDPERQRHALAQLGQPVERRFLVGRGTLAQNPGQQFRGLGQ